MKKLVKRKRSGEIKKLQKTILAFFFLEKIYFSLHSSQCPDNIQQGWNLTKKNQIY